MLCCAVWDATEDARRSEALRGEKILKNGWQKYSKKKTRTAWGKESRRGESCLLDSSHIVVFPRKVKYKYLSDTRLEPNRVESRVASHRVASPRVETISNNAPMNLTWQPVSTLTLKVQLQIAKLELEYP